MFSIRPSLADPADHAAAVVPSDDTDLTVPALALYVGVNGDVRLKTVSGETVTFVDVPVGILPVRTRRVYSTGTTATDIVACW